MKIRILCLPTLIKYQLFFSFQDKVGSVAGSRSDFFFTAEPDPRGKSNPHSFMYIKLNFYYYQDIFIVDFFRLSSGCAGLTVRFFLPAAPGPSPAWELCRFEFPVGCLGIYSTFPFFLVLFLIQSSLCEISASNLLCIKLEILMPEKLIFKTWGGGKNK